MDIKIIFAVLATVTGIVGFAPYIMDVWNKTTRPHVFTWVIWGITQGTATAGLLYGGGGFGAIPMAISVALTVVVVLLSIRLGSKNITKGDVVVFAAAIFAVFVWWKLESPLMAVIMVSLIDVAGYIPTFRKSYNEPWAETISSWVAFALANGFAILAVENYNLLTVSYLAIITLANLALVAFLLVRRKDIKR